MTFTSITPARYLASPSNTRRGNVRWPEEVVLDYQPLLVVGRFSDTERRHQVKGARKARLPRFETEIIPDNFGTRQKKMHLKGTIPGGNFREPGEVERFLIDKGFNPESIKITDGTLYATHPKEHLPFMHWVVRLLIHFQATGEWLNILYWYADYPDQ
ncbi:hypothetical protein [Shewanella indica]|uniref:hypothetical protein n=1 Tax=Shewanella indica TaxID=768528 RepID=UPI003007A077